MLPEFSSEGERGVIEVRDYDKAESSPRRPHSELDYKQAQVMCWKDPNKVCQCEHPQLGVFCGRYPVPTD